MKELGYDGLLRPGRFLVCRAFTRETSNSRSSGMSYRGIHTLVDCKATVRTLQLSKALCHFADRP